MNRLGSPSATVARRRWMSGLGWPLAGVLAVVSLALPWRNSRLDFGITTAYLPGYCHISYDGYSYCDPGSIGWGTYTSINGPVPGFAGPIRVLAVLAALLMWWAWRHRSRWIARLGLGLAVLGWFAGGFVLTSGRLVFALALLVAADALDRQGLLRSRLPPDRPLHAAGPARRRPGATTVEPGR